MTAATLTTTDGVTLEARGDAPPDATRVVVFCHPHPEHGGTMSVPLMVAVTKALADHGIAVVRFNFRGVGRSGGTHDGGRGERRDVDAAVSFAAGWQQGAAIAVAGWSFGAAVALAWQAETGSTLPYVGIAPPLSPGSFSGLPAQGEVAPAPRTFVFGDRDQFTSIAAADAYASSIGARLEIIKGSDHFFTFREERVAAIIAGAIGDASDAQPQ